MSFWVSAIDAARMAVKMPIEATTIIVSGACAKIGEVRATKYTPAFTIVAAWISADTGVGPSIASGSQTWNGNCALLPAAPTNSSSATMFRMSGSASPKGPKDAWMFSVPVMRKTPMMPIEEALVGDAVDEERLLRRERRRAARVPEADQQVAREADQLPRAEEDEVPVREHEEEHREHEEVEVGEEAPATRVVGHVPDAVDVDERADPRDHDEQDRGQVVDEEARIDVEVAGGDPRVEREADAVLAVGARQRLPRDDRSRSPPPRGCRRPR